MFNSYYAGNTNLKINACSGGIYKTYKESWFKKFKLDGYISETLFREKGCYYRAGKGYSTNKWDLVDTYNEGLDEVKEVTVIQMIICGDKEVIAEIMYKDDLDKYFENKDLLEKEGK